MRFPLARQARFSTIFVVLLVATSCGGGTDKSSPPQPTPTVARIEVTPAAALLTASGQQKPFSAQAFDANGTELDISITWESSNPTNVQIDSNGIASTISDLGSSQIIAVAQGVRSAPALVLIAEPVEGAILVADAQVVTGPQLIRAGPDETLLGAHLAYTLRDVPVPTINTIMLASEATPLAGRVVSATPAGQVTQVVLEVVPLSEWFHTFQLDESFSLAGIEPVLEDLPGSVTVTHAGEETRILYEPPTGRTLAQSRFVCEGSIGDLLDVSTFTLEQSITGSVDINHRKATKYEPMELRIVLNGKLAVAAKGGIFAKIGLSGSGQCTVRIGSIPLRFLGAFSIAFSPAIALEGVVKVNEISITAVTLEAGMEGEVGQQASIGFHYTGTSATSSGGFVPVQSIEPIYSIKPTFKAPTMRDMRLDGKLSVGPQLSLRAQFGTIGVVSLVDISLLEAGAGLVGEISFAHPVPQAQDSAYASKYGLNVAAWFGLGDGIEKILNALDADKHLGITGELETPPLLKLLNSPTGTLTADAAQVNFGDSVLFSVELVDDYIPWFGDNVETVELYSYRGGEEPTYLGTMDRLGTNFFMYDWTAPSLYDGDYYFVAFIRSFLAPSFPLEIADDSTVTVNVVGVCEAPSNPDGPSDPTDPGDPDGPGDPAGETWAGEITMTTVYNGPEGNYNVSIHKEERWTDFVDPNPDPYGKIAFFDANWTVNGTRAGSSGTCSFTGEFNGSGPYTSLVFEEDPFDNLAYTIYTASNGESEPQATGYDQVTCDNKSYTVETVDWASFLMPPIAVEGRVDAANPNLLHGSTTYEDQNTVITLTWNLTRPECAQ